MIKTIVRVLTLATAMTMASAAEENNTGLVGIREITVNHGQLAPNGYYFETSHPDHYKAFVSYRFSPEGDLALRSTAQGGYASWELRPEPRLKPGSKNRISAEIFHSGFAPGQHIGLEIFSFNLAGNPQVVTHILHRPQAAGVWHTVSGEFTVPEDSARIRVRVDLTTPGELYFRNLLIGYPASSGDTAEWQGETVDLSRPWIADENLKSTLETVTRYDGDSLLPALQPHSLSYDEEGVMFQLRGEAGKNSVMKWAAPMEPRLNLKNAKYYQIKLQAAQISRTMPPLEIVKIRGTDASGNSCTIPLALSNHVFDDGKPHTILGTLPENISITEFVVELRTKHPEALVKIHRLDFFQNIPEMKFSGSEKESDLFSPVNLQPWFNRSLTDCLKNYLEQYSVLPGGYPVFSSPSINVDGIPFSVATDGNNLILPPKNDLNDQEIPFLGETLSRRSVNPISREDSITVPIGTTGSELYFLLFNPNNPAQTRYALAPRPSRFDDMENLTVELEYADGRTSKAFPYSVTDQAFYIPNRIYGVFAVKMEAKSVLKSIKFYFYSHHLNFAIAAVTVNTGSAKIAAFKERPPEKFLPIAENQSCMTSVEHDNTMLSLINQYGRFHFNLKNGFSLEKIITAQNTPLGMSPGSGFALRIGSKIFSGRCFKVNDVVPGRNHAEIKLTSELPELQNLSVGITLRDAGKGAVGMHIRVTNTGQQKVTATIMAGVLQQFFVGNISDTTIFFPQYRAVVTSTPCVLKAPYGFEFPHQFLDLYNPKTAWGLTIAVDNRNNHKIEFCAEKNAQGVNASINTIEDFSEIPPGMQLEMPEVFWQLHQGDFKSAVANYKSVLNEHSPRKIPKEREYFQNTFAMTTYHTTDTLSRLYFHVPPILSKDKSTFLLDEMIDFDSKHLGHKPDFVHLWWTYNDQKKYEQHGWYNSELYYAQSGGLKNFRQAIMHAQNELGVPVSLYTISDRVTTHAMSPETPEKDKIAVGYKNGGLMANAEEIYTCRYADAWIDFAVQDLAQLMLNTGAKILYSDVMSSFSSSRCFSEKHGHGIPSNSLRADEKFMQALRKALPSDRAIWTEYPFPDTTNHFADGAISYYFMELSEFFAPVYGVNDRINTREFTPPFALIRYLHPTYKVFSLPCGIEAGSKPSQMDYIFFNGDVFHEVTWRLVESRVRERVNQALKIKKEYPDCFNSEHPEMRHPTLAGGVYANKFPGKNREIYTLFNAGHATVDTPILSLVHRPGQMYYDLFSGQELHPVMENNQARISLRIDPQSNGAVLQTIP